MAIIPCINTLVAKLNSEERIPALAMLDTGSEISIISTRVADELRISRKVFEQTLVGITGHHTRSKVRKSDITVTGLKGQFPVNISVIVLPTVCGRLREVNIDPSEEPTFSKVQFVVQYPQPDQEVDILLGSDVYFQVVNNIRLAPSGLACLFTRWGPVLAGQLRNRSVSNLNSTTTNGGELETALQKLWQIESLGIVDSTNKEKEADLYVENQFEHNITFVNDERRYYVSIIFNPETSGKSIKSNYKNAVRRMEGVERRLLINPELAESFLGEIKNNLSNDWVEEVRGEDEAERAGDGKFYLPMGIVVRPDVESSKARLVFDASAKNKVGESINDVIFGGPKTQADILKILVGLRFHRVALKSDLSKMFHQIGLNQSDRDVTRFVWRNLNLKSEVKVYRWKRLPFGLAQSPFLAIKTVLHHIKVMEEEYPEACKCLLENLYVDDVVTGAETEAEAERLCGDMIKIMTSGGFTLRKWLSNSRRVLRAVPEEYRSVTSTHVFTEKSEESVTSKTLGVEWDPKADRFSFKGYSILIPEEKETKRTLISKLAKIYDPCGLLSPFLVLGKQLMQECWLRGLTWDEKLPQDIGEKWVEWLKDVPALSGINPRRCLKPPGKILRRELHIFSDASEKAYAACAYIRFVTYSPVATEGPAFTGLLVSKARVAPLKKLSLPRLELLGIVIAARLAASLSQQLNISKEDIHMWTDSTICVSWLRRQPTRWTTFVGNRVAEVQELILPSQVKHLPGKENVCADAASRGLLASELSEMTAWLEGPSFLKYPPDFWPETYVEQDTNEERVMKSNPGQEVKTDEFWTKLYQLAHKFENRFPSLLRVGAYVLRFVQNLKSTKENRELSKVPKVSEVRKSILLFMQVSQRTHLLSTYLKLKGGRGLPALTSPDEKKLLKLLPIFCEKTQVLRCGGRLMNADLPERSKFPIILPNQCRIVELLVLNLHWSLVHAPLNQTLFELRAKYHILKGRSEIRRILHHCYECRRMKAQPYGQMMGQLPADRVKANPAFHTVGVDTAGPFKLRRKEVGGNVMVDRHIILFTCFSTRAIHLEVLNNLSTESVIMSIKELCSRRGVPRTIWSDNAKSFQKCSRELQKLYKSIDKEKLTRLCLQLPEPVSWQFIPERAPHFGGVWERMVRSVKTALRATLSRSQLEENLFRHTVTVVEGQINARPISSISEGVEDALPLTPAHLMYGRSLTQLPDNIGRDDVKDKVGIKWRARQALSQLFWNRWKKEYLSELLGAQKWHLPQKSPQVDEVLLVAEDGPRNMWLLGRVIDIKHGRDNLVRSCLVKTRKGVLRRPVHRLHRLEVDLEETSF